MYHELKINENELNEIRNLQLIEIVNIHKKIDKDLKGNIVINLAESEVNFIKII